MRYLRQLCCILTLLCLFATVALADDGIIYPQHPAPPPPPSITGIIYPQGSLAVVLEEVVNLLQTMTGHI